MNKLKELWQYPVFRWCVYVTSLVVFVLLLRYGFLSTGSYKRIYSSHKQWDLLTIDLKDFATLIWILIFALPALWVWRKPIWKMVKQALGFLNKKAEEG